jgi:NAD(P)H-dependent FMN reductase
VPPYDGDLDGTEPPEAVADLRRRIREADGLLIATPEYNYSILGVLKNAIDWASRRRRRHRSSTSTLPSWAPRLAISAR